MRPGQTLQCPLVVGIFRSQLYGYLAQHGVIIRSFVMAHTAPVDRFSGNGGVRIILRHAGVALLRIRPFLVHESYACEAHFQTRAEPVLWQVAFDAITLDGAGVHYQNGRRPKCVEAMEPRRMLFDVSFERNKVLMDEACDFLVAVGLGFQPSTSASSRRRREVNQHRFVLRLGFGQSGIDILLPIDEHASTFLF